MDRRDFMARAAAATGYSLIVQAQSNSALAADKILEAEDKSCGVHIRSPHASW